MFAISAVKNVLKNSLESNNEFVRVGETFTKYNSKNEKFNIHITIAKVQIFKDSQHVKSANIEAKKDFKEVEKHVKDLLKFIKEHTI